MAFPLSVNFSLNTSSTFRLTFDRIIKVHSIRITNSPLSTRFVIHFDSSSTIYRAGVTFNIIGRFSGNNGQNYMVGADIWNQIFERRFKYEPVRTRNIYIGGSSTSISTGTLNFVYSF